MKVFTRLEEAASFPRARAVAVGNFDGVHLGHQKILRCLVRQARRRRLFSLLLTFSPHPEKILGKGRMLMIQTLDQRLREVEKFGVDAVLVMPFGLRFSTLPPGRFLESVLVSALRARAVLVGQNFHFGRKRAGSVATLREFGQKAKAFEVCIVPPVNRDGGPVSSSRIRSLLREGNVEKAGVLLGRPYEIVGTVIPGHSLGRRIGFPTANIKAENEILPPGIYISRARLGRNWHPAVTYLGQRPTFGRGGFQVETYLLGHQGSFYGSQIAVQLLRRLRSDRKFESPAALARQIRLDVRRAEKHFAERKE